MLKYTKLHLYTYIEVAPNNFINEDYKLQYINIICNSETHSLFNCQRSHLYVLSLSRSLQTTSMMKTYPSLLRLLRHVSQLWK